jgi:ribonucleoside-triphosphate reductase
MGATPVCPTCGKDMMPCCPICGKEVEVYSRVVGYLRPIKTWNPGKVEEYARRKEFIFRKLEEHQRPE